MERRFGFTVVGGCEARAPNGTYAGFVCCAQKGHDDDHAITSGSVEPPHYVIVYEWPDRGQETDG